MSDLYHVSESKYTIETVSLFGDFSGSVLPGEIISGIPTVSISVVSGIDPTPSTLLYLGVSVHNGLVVEQRIREGIPGVIYSILFTVLTTLGNTYEQETYLAILPESGVGIPTFTLQYETSSLYPIIYTDNLQALPSISTGRLAQTAIRYQESIQAAINVTSGHLTFYGITIYSYMESIQASVLIAAGNMVNYPIIPYSYMESIYAAVAITAGNMVNYPIITYSYMESIQASPSITGGALR